MLKFSIATNSREEIVDITANAQACIQAANFDNGAILVFCPHTTCGLTINEGADPDVKADLMKFFRSIAPHKGNWAHMEGNSDAHIRASLLGASLLVPVENGVLSLGRWQSIYLYEGDGPRSRSIWVQFLAVAQPPL